MEAFAKVVPNSRVPRSQFSSSDRYVVRKPYRVFFQQGVAQEEKRLCVLEILINVLTEKLSCFCKPFLFYC